MEREARTAAAAEARTARDKSRRQALARRMPKDVIMSEQQRRMVEGVLRGLSGDPALSGSTAATKEGAEIARDLWLLSPVHVWGASVACPLLCSSRIPPACQATLRYPAAQLPQKRVRRLENVLLGERKTRDAQ